MCRISVYFCQQSIVMHAPRGVFNPGIWGTGQILWQIGQIEEL